MAPYDSDSSGGEEEDYTETNVLLGYASPDANGEEISKLGGNPVCKDIMVLLLQLNAELPDRFPGHERRLYVLACKRKSCRRNEGSIRAIRGTRVSETTALAAAKETQPKETPAPKAKSSATAPSNPFTTQNPPRRNQPFQHRIRPLNPSSNLRPNPLLNNPNPPLPTLPQPVNPGLNPPAPYPTRWLADADYETLDPITLPNIPIGPTQMEFDSGEGRQRRWLRQRR
ncbi:hypothetical protein N0V88_006324 [Collariella sp. IMI 366227]|nr:hypothetical protein N0V88_006324 [Collariella sp. IMI 366227]